MWKTLESQENSPVFALAIFFVSVYNEDKLWGKVVRNVEDSHEMAIVWAFPVFSPLEGREP